MQSDGMQSDDMWCDGIASDGVGSDGVGSDGVGSDGEMDGEAARGRQLAWATRDSRREAQPRGTELIKQVHRGL